MLELFNNYQIFNDPYNFYSFIRSECPVIYNEDKTVALSKHSDISTVLSSPYSLKNIEEFVKHPNQTILNLQKIRENYFYGLKTFFDIDGQEHEQIRNSISSFFSKTSVTQYQKYIEDTTSNILKNFSKNDEFDIHKEVFHQISLKTISNIIGIPQELEAELTDNINMVTRLFEPCISSGLANKIGQSANFISDFLVEAVSFKKNNLDKDMLSDLIQNGNDISKIMSVIVPLYVAGHITTSYLLSTALECLLNDTDQKNIYLSDPTNNNYLEEIIRYDPPAHIIQRVVSKDFQVSDTVSLSEGTLVYLFIASANRDEMVFDEANKFILQRKNANRNISFAAGAHYCMGSALVKLQLMTILPKILKTFPDIQQQKIQKHNDVAVKQIKNHMVRL